MNAEEAKSLRWILGLGLLLHVLAAIFSQGFYQGDEHFQILEFSQLKLHPASVLEMPWEYTAQIRAWFLPALFTGLLWPLKLLSLDSPFVGAFAARLVSAFLGLFVSLKLFLHFNKEWQLGPSTRRWLLGLTLFLFYVPFFHARTSGENWSGALFFWGWLCWQQKSFWRAGLLMGLAFEARFQSGLFIFGAVLGRMYEVVRQRESRSRETLAREILGLVGGLLLAFGIGRLLDSWGYGTWVLSPWNYFTKNLIEGEAARHGTSSAWEYLVKWLVLLPPLGALLLVAFVRGLFKLKNPSLLGALVLFVGAHLVISHKELRFLFPILYILPVLVYLGLQRPEKVSEGLWRGAGRLLGLVNFAGLLFLTLTPAKSEIGFYRAVSQIMEDKPRPEFRYHHVGDDPLRYAGLRPQFYLPFRLESIRLENYQEFNSGYLLLSEREVGAPELRKILEESNCETLWSDSLYPFRKSALVGKILRSTKYRYQVLLVCE